MNEKHLRRKVLDKEGNPVINQFGHAITPELTKNEITYVEQELAKGRSVRGLAIELETTETRIKQIRDNKDSHTRMMDYQKSVLIPAKLDTLIEFVLKQSEQIDELSKSLSKLVTEQGRVRKALYLKQIGEAKLRTDNRNLKNERDELRKLLHKKTGIDVGPYKRDD
ncbi:MULTISPECIES: hypothetical protein [unclassified Sphingopyxis]|uniref:hypothetical protein n=1 Tax=unclassified Sphingopyxis TaxID=2614943 RepID=UPI000730A88C|nr:MULTISPECIES: hypothetical protein [unclassified Sphingopyxis]KTE19892.1 hypothetical protein ATE61_20220 [Sphingopyxis sp. H057]KTE48879.1 hypothetical protein ATE64_20170 [Sphingopyxis sp. H073]KTE53310.1 hypothetical protein ATE69_13430 [Sphingopyxis sp. H071]KTE55334.1 hypothetical protein ATE66_19785 [Sphingopyxis sp. H107]KTE60209.1 hypothetical protein ATE65_19530 [Sphingopyxis sp. H100]